jgi:ABC-type Fe3+/spermidine/putrescine transport system ATPase subunit
MSREPVLVLDGVVKRYGEAAAVGPIDLQVRRGEFLTLLGPSGCGKTTTLHVIAGLIAPSAGRVSMGGREMTHVEPRHRDIGLVFQNYALFPHKTIFDNVSFGLRMRKVSRAEIRTRVQRMLDLVGLPGVDERFPDQLSGGQRQRVALARALVIEPAMLLLDEPLSNLDAVLRRRMRAELSEVQRRLGITAIYVTHDQDEAFEMSDRVVLLNHGHIEQMGTPEELYDEPATRFVAEFIGEANLIAGSILAVNGDGAVRVRLPGDIDLAANAAIGDFREGDSAYLMVRPERIELAHVRPSGLDVVEATIKRRVFSGEQMIFELVAPGGINLVCSKPSLPRYRALSLGDSVWAIPEGCRVLRRTDAP